MSFTFIDLTSKCIGVSDRNRIPPTGSNLHWAPRYRRHRPSSPRARSARCASRSHDTPLGRTRPPPPPPTGERSRCSAGAPAECSRTLWPAPASGGRRRIWLWPRPHRFHSRRIGQACSSRGRWRANGAVRFGAAASAGRRARDSAGR